MKKPADPTRLLDGKPYVPAAKTNVAETIRKAFLANGHSASSLYRRLRLPEKLFTPDLPVITLATLQRINHPNNVVVASNPHGIRSDSLFTTRWPEGVKDQEHFESILEAADEMHTLMFRQPGAKQQQQRKAVDMLSPDVREMLSMLATLHVLSFRSMVCLDLIGPVIMCSTFRPSADLLISAYIEFSESGAESGNVAFLGGSNFRFACLGGGAVR